MTKDREKKDIITLDKLELTNIWHLYLLHCVNMLPTQFFQPYLPSCLKVFGELYEQVLLLRRHLKGMGSVIATRIVSCRNVFFFLQGTRCHILVPHRSYRRVVRVQRQDFDIRDQGPHPEFHVWFNKPQSLSNLNQVP